MKILYDFEIFTRQKYGGISRYFYEIISGLSMTNRYNLDLYLGFNNTGYKFDDINPNVYQKSYKIKYADKYHFLLQGLNKFLFDKYSKSSDFNLFHKTYYSDVGLQINNNIISTVHDMTHELYPQYFAKSDNTSLLKKKCVNESEGIICVSKTTKKNLVEIFNVNPSKIRVIYHGVSVNNNIALHDIIGEPYILYVGQRWGYKNFNALLRVYYLNKKLNKNFKLVCFGGGKFNLKEKLFLKEKKIENRVMQVAGSDNKLSSLYINAELLVYTSYYEGFGFPPLEAMLCGCPVLTSPAGSVQEVCGDSVIYFDPAQSEDLSEKLISVLGDSVVKQTLIKNGLLKSKQFTWEKSVLAHAEYYNEFKN